MTNIVLCDLPNTLFDSRHRSTEDTLCITDIKSDKINKTALFLLRDLQKLNYSFIYTHYCLTRLADIIEEMLKKHIPAAKLYTNFATQQVYNNQTLKEHILLSALQSGYQICYAIDNDTKMTAFYHNNKIPCIRVPL